MAIAKRDLDFTIRYQLQHLKELILKEYPKLAPKPAPQSYELQSNFYDSRLDDINFQVLNVIDLILDPNSLYSKIKPDLDTFVSRCENSFPQDIFALCLVAFCQQHDIGFLDHHYEDWELSLLYNPVELNQYFQHRQRKNRKILDYYNTVLYLKPVRDNVGADAADAKFGFALYNRGCLLTQFFDIPKELERLSQRQPYLTHYFKTKIASEASQRENFKKMAQRDFGEAAVLGYAPAQFPSKIISAADLPKAMEWYRTLFPLFTEEDLPDEYLPHAYLPDESLANQKSNALTVRNTDVKREIEPTFVELALQCRAQLSQSGITQMEIQDYRAIQQAIQTLLFKDCYRILITYWLTSEQGNDYRKLPKIVPSLFKILNFCQRMSFERMFQFDIATNPNFSAQNTVAGNHQALYQGFLHRYNETLLNNIQAGLSADMFKAFGNLIFQFLRVETQAEFLERFEREQKKKREAQDADRKLLQEQRLKQTPTPALALDYSRLPTDSKRSTETNLQPSIPKPVQTVASSRGLIFVLSRLASSFLSAISDSTPSQTEPQASQTQAPLLAAHSFNGAIANHEGLGLTSAKPVEVVEIDPVAEYQKQIQAILYIETRIAQELARKFFLVGLGYEQRLFGLKREPGNADFLCFYKTAHEINPSDDLILRMAMIYGHKQIFDQRGITERIEFNPNLNIPAFTLYASFSIKRHLRQGHDPSLSTRVFNELDKRLFWKTKRW